MNESPAEIRIQVLERSLSTFTLGTLGLLPLIGFPMALLALSSFRRVCLVQSGQWNAARVYLIWGFVLASIGLVISIVTFGVILYLAFTDQLF